MFESFFHGFFPRVFSMFRDVATAYEPQISMAVVVFLVLSFFIKRDLRKFAMGVAAVLASFKYHFLPDDMLNVFDAISFYMCTFMFFLYLVEMSALKKLEKMEENDKKNDSD